MKISEPTLNILKNFAGINTNILIKPGKELSTISTMRNIFAKAEITEEFSKEFGIYDLNEFLSVVSASSEVSLKDKQMDVSTEFGMTEYLYSDPSVIVSPTKDVTMPEPDVTFTLEEKKLKEMLEFAGKLHTPDLALVGTNGGKISLTTCDKKNSQTSKFSLDVAEGATADFTFYFKVENMKMLPGNYDVSVSSKSISHFKHTTLPLEYWIALEPDSKFSK